MVSEAKARRLARVSSVRFEASFGGASEEKYESRLMTVRRYNTDCPDRDIRLFWSTKPVSQSN